MSKERIKILSKKIIKARQEYYNGQPTVSDKAFDAWIDELAKLDPNHPAVTGVGALPTSEWKKVAHEVPMGSLNKVNTEEEFSQWHKSDCNSPALLLCTEKLDGISLNLIYKNGTFVGGHTRGDGSTGEDITTNVIKMKGVCKQLSKPFTGEIRSEIVLLKSDHKKHFPDYANPRNAASGIAKRYDGDGAENLTVLSYTVEGQDFSTELESFQFIESVGLKTPQYEVATLAGAIKLWKQYQISMRDELDYEIDGLVFRVNDRASQFALGEKNHRPKGAIAFKFEAPTAETTITNIVWQVGNSGRITPVAEFGEVELLGAKVKRASLYNQSYIEEIGVSIGSTVIVKRANDVIPRVEEVLKLKGAVAKSPDTCPECSTKTVRTGEYLICPNKKTCPPQILGRLSIWISELNILEWGDKVVQKLIDADIVSDVADLYTIKVSDIENLDRMGTRSAQNLVAEMDKYRSIPLENLIGGLGIENVATSTVKLVISAGYDSLDKIKVLSVAKLENIPGFGSIKAKAFQAGLKENEDRIQAILDAGVTIRAKTVGVLTGKSFCFTGASTLPRAKLQKLVEDNGGEVKKSVGKGLTYLVSADKDSTSSKAQAAKKNNTTLLTEEEFMKMI